MTPKRFQSQGERVYRALEPGTGVHFYRGKPWVELTDAERAVWQAIASWVVDSQDAGEDVPIIEPVETCGARGYNDGLCTKPKGHAGPHTWRGTFWGPGS